LPYPTLKIVIIPAESTLSYGWVAGYVEKYGDDKRGKEANANFRAREV
jgi:hypothetical protein